MLVTRTEIEPNGFAGSATKVFPSGTQLVEILSSAKSLIRVAPSMASSKLNIIGVCRWLL